MWMGCASPVRLMMVHCSTASVPVTAATCTHRPTSRAGGEIFDTSIGSTSHKETGSPYNALRPASYPNMQMLCIVTIAQSCFKPKQLATMQQPCICAQKQGKRGQTCCLHDFSASHECSTWPGLLTGSIQVCFTPCSAAGLVASTLPMNWPMGLPLDPKYSSSANCTAAQQFKACTATSEECSQRWQARMQ